MIKVYVVIKRNPTEQQWQSLSLLYTDRTQLDYQPTLEVGKTLDPKLPNPLGVRGSRVGFGLKLSSDFRVEFSGGRV